MSKPNDGGPAFPIRGFCADASGALTDQVINNPGMTLRDYFAGEVAGPLSRAIWVAGDYCSDSKLWPPKKVAAYAYELADAMLAAREKGTP